MKCQTHLERESVGICEDCKAPICQECSDNFGGLCIKCAERAVAEGRKDVLITCAISIGLFIVALMYNINMGYMKTDPVENIITSIMFGFIPYGWKGVSVVTNYLLPVAAGLGVMGMLLYFVLKLVAAITIGWILAIPKIIATVKTWKACDVLDHNVKTMKMIPSSRCVND